MLRAIKSFYKKYMAWSEAYDDESMRQTFAGELNYASGKIFFVIFMPLALWLPFITNDLQLHQFPSLAVSIRIGICLLTVCLIALKLTKRFRRRPGLLLKVIAAYLYLGTSIITATAGEAVPGYIGQFVFIIMVPVVLPFSLRFKFTLATLALAVFFVTGALTGLDFPGSSLGFISADLLVPFIASIVMSIGYYIVRHNAWIEYQKLKSVLNDVNRQDNLLYKIDEAIALLFNWDIDEFEKDLYQSMGMIAGAVGVDRVYIWENYDKDDKLYCSRLYEWSENGGVRQSDDTATGVAYSDTMPEWEKPLSEGQCINRIVRELSAKEQAALAPRGIRSILVIPVFIQGKFWGIIGFDDCRNERQFTENEEMLLRSVSHMIFNALLRQDMMLNIRDAYAQFETIWLNVESGIFIVDAQTREILDINPLAANMIGADRSGIIGCRCHKFVCPADEGACPILDKNQVVDRSERVLITVNGETLPIIKSVAKITYKGRLALLESFTDISSLKNAESQLKLIKGQLEAALDKAQAEVAQKAISLRR